MTNDPRSDATDRVPTGAPSAPPTEPFAQPLAPVTPTSPMPAPVRSRPSGAGVLINVLLGLALVVAVGGVAFAVGRVTAPAAVAAGGNGRFGNGGPFAGGPNASGAPGTGGFVGGGFGGAGGLSIEGKVTAVSADSITLQLAGGQTVTIPTNAETTYHSRQPATAADVTSGSTVQVQLQGGRGFFGGGNGSGNTGNGNGNGRPSASGQPRTLPTAGSITVLPAGS